MATYAYNILRVGINNNGGIGIVLTDRARNFTTKWFTLPPSVAKEMMALSLTALASNLPIYINIEPEKLATDWPTLNWIEMFRE